MEYLSVGLQTVQHLKIETVLQKIHEFNISAFEIFFNGFLPRDISHQVRILLEKLKKTPEFLLTVHTPLIGLSESFWFDVMEECLEFAQKCGARLCTIHPDPDPSKFLQKAIPLIKLALKDYKEITILIENTPSTPADIMNEIFSQIKQYKNVGLTYDMGHSQLAPLTSHNQKKSAVEYLEKLNGPILECHIHTNRGKEDEHLSIRDTAGIIDLKAIIRTLIERKKFTGPLIFEYYRGDMREDIQLLKDLINIK
jgi:sugar phosphate isomerase/epimerase